ncbi:S8/S53 family peptidase [Pseudaestuariivita rosea]|uniref:S8/S53 family peptidase n=1 Tax=Pseudaestuariivita rosea TaxID=2763263 RepID=UPI001ABA8F4F|nr:S8/S53 family peptidase [Pseudaestuariivita rosea]
MQKHVEIAQEVYTDYDALWHLVTMGVLDSDHAPSSGTSAQTTKPIRVAMIDTSVAVDHPNLKDAINHDLSLDLFSNRLGAFSYHDPDDKLGAIDLNTATGVTAGLPRTAAILSEFIDRLSHGSRSWVDGVQPTVSPAFSSHGTAIAGLIGGRATVESEVYGASAVQPSQIPLPYRGVDPNCEIVPISTNFDIDPESLIVAFLYAELIDADVVVLPRTIPDPTRMYPELSQIKIDGKSLMELTSPEELTHEMSELWNELAELIINVSINRPVVCAGGNSNELYGIYPANLADDNNGIISVGSVNAKGYISSYSSHQNVTVFAPSDDAEAFSSAEVRLDEQRHSYSSVGVPPINSNRKFSHFDIISTDVPGVHGYSRSPFQGTVPDAGIREFGSYYCRFGGTSAASALVGGFLALGQSSGALCRESDGIAKKTWLLSKCVPLANEAPDRVIPSWTGSVAFADSRG